MIKTHLVVGLLGQYREGDWTAWKAQFRETVTHNHHWSVFPTPNREKHIYLAVEVINFVILSSPYSPSMVVKQLCAVSSTFLFCAAKNRKQRSSRCSQEYEGEQLTIHWSCAKLLCVHHGVYHRPFKNSGYITLCDVTHRFSGKQILGSNVLPCWQNQTSLNSQIIPKTRMQHK